MNAQKRIGLIAIAPVALAAAAILCADRAAPAEETGSIVGWGSQVVGVDLSGDFISVKGGRDHGPGLKADGSVVAWGNNNYGQCDVPEPNSDFLSVAAGQHHSLGLKADGSIAAWGRNEYGQCNVPEPNEDFVAVGGGAFHSLGLKADDSIVAWGDNSRAYCFSL